MAAVICCAAASAAVADCWTGILKRLGRKHCAIPATSPGVELSSHERLGLARAGIPLMGTGFSPFLHGGHFCSLLIVCYD